MRGVLTSSYYNAVRFNFVCKSTLLSGVRHKKTCGTIFRPSTCMSRIDFSLYFKCWHLFGFILRNIHFLYLSLLWFLRKSRGSSILTELYYIQKELLEKVKNVSVFLVLIRFLFSATEFNRIKSVLERAKAVKKRFKTVLPVWYLKVLSCRIDADELVFSVRYKNTQWKG